MADVKNPPPGGFQNGGWYWDPSIGQARQYYNGQFGPGGNAGANWWTKSQPQAQPQQQQTQSSSPTQTNVPTSTYSNPIQTVDPMALAGSIQAFNINANKPAVATLQAQGTSLRDQYSNLLNAVLGEGTVAQQYAERGASSALAARGILPGTQPGGDVLYNQQMSQALLPVTAQYQAEIANLGMGSAQDLNQLAAQIAAYQAGNPVQNTGAALGYGQNLTGLAEQFAQANLGAQTGLAESKIGASVPFAIQPGYGVYAPATGKFSFANNYNAQGQPTGGGSNEDLKTMSLAKNLAAKKQAADSKTSRKPISGISRFVTEG